MPAFPPAPISPAEFMEAFLPRAFAESRRLIATMPFASAPSQGSTAPLFLQTVRHAATRGERSATKSGPQNERRCRVVP